MVELKTKTDFRNVKSKESFSIKFKKSMSCLQMNEKSMRNVENDKYN